MGQGTYLCPTFGTGDVSVSHFLGQETVSAFHFEPMYIAPLPNPRSKSNSFFPQVAAITFNHNQNRRPAKTKDSRYCIYTCTDGTIISVAAGYLPKDCRTEKQRSGENNNPVKTKIKENHETV